MAAGRASLAGGAAVGGPGCVFWRLLAALRAAWAWPVGGEQGIYGMGFAIFGIFWLNAVTFFSALASPLGRYMDASLAERVK